MIKPQKEPQKAAAVVVVMTLVTVMGEDNKHPNTACHGQSCVDQSVVSWLMDQRRREDIKHGNKGRRQWYVAGDEVERGNK